MMYFAYRCFAFAFCFGLGTNLRSEGELDIGHIEQKVIAQRQSIASGRVKVTSHCEFSDGRYRKVDLDIFFDPANYRADCREEQGFGNGLIKSSRYSRAWCEDAFRFFSEEVASYIAANDHRAVPAIDDVRLVGMYPIDFANLDGFALNSRIGNRGSGNVNLEEERRDERLLYRITYDAAWGRDIVWVSPSQDFSIVRMEHRGKEGNKLRTLHVKLDEVEGFGWFPRHLDFAMFEGDQVEKTETLTIDVIQFNMPITPDIWTFRGMGAPVGKKVLNRATNEQILLNSDGVSLSDRRTFTMSDSGLESSSPNGFLYYALGVSCLLISMGLLYRRFIANR